MGTEISNGMSKTALLVAKSGAANEESALGVTHRKMRATPRTGRLTLRFMGLCGRFKQPTPRVKKLFSAKGRQKTQKQTPMALTN